MPQQFDILAIDDEPVILDSISKIAGLGGFLVDTAVSAEEALSKLGCNSYKMILCDLMLPGAAGTKLIKSAESTHPDLPKIIMTGFSTLSVAIESFKCGVFDFLPKPFDVPELLAILTRARSFFEERVRSHALKRWLASYPLEVRGRFHFLGMHSWAILTSDGRARIGIAEAFSCCLPNLSRIDVAKVGAVLTQGAAFARFYEDRDDAVHTVWSPVGGRVVEVNPDVLQDPSLITRSPFDQGWITSVESNSLLSEFHDLSVRT